MQYDSTTSATVSLYLDSVRYPAKQHEIVAQISAQAPPPEVMELVHRLPAREYATRQETANFFESIATEQLITDNEDVDEYEV